jgi:hypothetical protein
MVQKADPVVKVLAAGGLCVLVEGAVKNQDWQGNQRNFSRRHDVNECQIRRVTHREMKSHMGMKSRNRTIGSQITVCYREPYANIGEPKSAQSGPHQPK